MQKACDVALARGRVYSQGSSDETVYSLVVTVTHKTVNGTVVYHWVKSLTCFIARSFL